MCKTISGCPSDVDELPQCSKPCPSNCEQCYPKTGICANCQHGYKGYACELICIAVADVIVTPASAINSSYDAMFSSNGLTFPSFGDVEVVNIYMTLSDQFNDISNMSVRVDNAMNFDVVLLGNDIQSTKFDVPNYGPPQGILTVQNSMNTKVYAIQITVLFQKPFTISNVKMPLMKCVKRITKA
ncbi:uncharacterized protein LOC128169348 [Crassostrea angulata]|uniref:uncharacterized protein LOC128169348 n=1 Tax=Magallana angulata TaxID=2784310 RepID=UPI0022B1E21F|nr:uncharacterized protein LOC128169348 [Crassostrea angulata]